jgi:hypothetical protein
LAFKRLFPSSVTLTPSARCFTPDAKKLGLIFCCSRKYPNAYFDRNNDWQYNLGKLRRLHFPADKPPMSGLMRHAI